MNEQDFQAKLGELINQINGLPEQEKAHMGQLAEETKTRHERMRQTIADLQESLDYLRLSIKYLVFDLEATRRENQYLRKLIDKASGTHGECENDQPE
jgi:chromosome segregation ATPase